ncbi:MAG: hypothetical protein NT029_02035 [Armatimonadetes bacterium]|nr:hypothetical protein [Armatimonadota bacterium]
MRRLALLAALLAAAASCAAAPGGARWRGVHFNPQVRADPNFPWMLHYATCRPAVRAALRELRTETGANLVDLFVMIPNSLRTPARGNRAGEPLEAWANLGFLDNVALFVDDCHEAGLSAELDLVDNRWIPYSVDPAGHVGRPDSPWWPTADETPWDEAAAWYAQVITAVEARARHPEAIAFWCMMGNYHWGAAEPVLWNDEGRPEILRWTERFVKRVWPAFRAAGRRPKAAPILLPILAEGGYWEKRTPAERLSGFANLKRWLVDDLKRPPDLWVMSTYPYCDPAPDGFSYLREIVRILGKGSARRLVSTDLKAVGHEDELTGTILRPASRTGRDALAWHLAKVREYGMAGWWIWAYQDTPASASGVRRLDGAWKREIVELMQAR